MKQPLGITLAPLAVPVAVTIPMAVVQAAQTPPPPAAGRQQRENPKPDPEKPRAETVEVEVSSRTVDLARIAAVDVKARTPADTDKLLKVTSARTGNIVVPVDPPVRRTASDSSAAKSRDPAAGDSALSTRLAPSWRRSSCNAAQPKTAARFRA